MKKFPLGALVSFVRMFSLQEIAFPANCVGAEGKRLSTRQLGWRFTSI